LIVEGSGRSREYSQIRDEYNGRIWYKKDALLKADKPKLSLFEMHSGEELAAIGECFKSGSIDSDGGVVIFGYNEDLSSHNKKFLESGLIGSDDSVVILGYDEDPNSYNK
jgi:hypothetical protein